MDFLMTGFLVDVQAGGRCSVRRAPAKHLLRLYGRGPVREQQAGAAAGTGPLQIGQCALL